MVGSLRSWLPLCPNVHLIARCTALSVEGVRLALSPSRIVGVPDVRRHPARRLEGRYDKPRGILDQAISNRPESDDQCGSRPAMCPGIRPHLSQIGDESVTTRV